MLNLPEWKKYIKNWVERKTETCLLAVFVNERQGGTSGMGSGFTLDAQTLASNRVTRLVQTVEFWTSLTFYWKHRENSQNVSVLRVDLGILCEA